MVLPPYLLPVRPYTIPVVGPEEACATKVRPLGINGHHHLFTERREKE